MDPCNLLVNGHLEGRKTLSIASVNGMPASSQQDVQALIAGSSRHYAQSPGENA